MSIHFSPRAGVAVSGMAVGDAVQVGVGLGVMVAVGVLVLVAVGVGVAVAVDVLVGVGVKVAVAVGVGVGVEVAVGGNSSCGSLSRLPVMAEPPTTKRASVAISPRHSASRRDGGFRRLRGGLVAAGPGFGRGGVSLGGGGRWSGGKRASAQSSPLLARSLPGLSSSSWRK